ncbi:hypothetical protein [Cyanobium sp. WAJ14-Wanaka]|uniref:hypothetical protein n=1 Tax=Cyanobium sp. WAJ14-Wanaka TaxID=2823725 RepID=UPI0020CD04D0|nr:hypothetical protein [Cyanobium sp. WAJ14-Wanaka]MCP9776165.1 hypothetical protein [Cyanobium sp. WAJ14-Wanaka]
MIGEIGDLWKSFESPKSPQASPNTAKTQKKPLSKYISIPKTSNHQEALEADFIEGIPMKSIATWPPKRRENSKRRL